MKRSILHCDLNCFYASVEMLLHPELRGKAIAVCGSTEDRHGIVLTKSEPAKRCGVKTGEAIWQAKLKCPELIIVPPDFPQYMKYSKAVRKIYEDYTDKVEAFGIDECWLDISGSLKLFGSAEKIADRIRTRVKQEIGLTISVGVSFNKIFAKLGSDMKKPDAVTVIPEENFREIVWKLPASDLFGVGRATKKKLAGYAINTIGDLALTDPKLLKLRLGVNGILLWRYANGLDSSPVAHMDFKPPIKSIGHGITCTRDLRTEDEIWRVFYELSEEISDRLFNEHMYANGIQISVRDKNLNIRQFQSPLEMATRSHRDIALKAFELYSKNCEGFPPIRSLTVRGINLSSDDIPVQLTLSCDPDKLSRQVKIEDCMREIRNRYGKGSIKFASLMTDIGLPSSYNSKPQMPTGLQR